MMPRLYDADPGEPMLAALLKIMVDPKAVQARLDEFQKARKAANQAILVAKKSSEDVAVAKLEVAKREREHASAVAAFEADLAQQRQELEKGQAEHAARVAELSRENRRLTDWDARLKGQASQLQQRDQHVGAREKEVARASAELAQTRQEAMQDRAAAAARLKSVQAALSAAATA